MSLTISTAKMNVFPSYYDGKNGRVYNCQIMQPVQHNIELSPQGKKPVEQMKAMLEKAKEEGLEVELDYTQSVNRFGITLIVYDVNFIKKG